MPLTSFTGKRSPEPVNPSSDDEGHPYNLRTVIEYVYVPVNVRDPSEHQIADGDADQDRYTEPAIKQHEDHH